MAKNPDGRYRKATDLAAHFAALVHNQPIPAQMPAPPPPLLAAAAPVHPKAKSKRPFLFAAFLLIPLLILLGVLWRQPFSIPVAVEPAPTAPPTVGDSNFTIILVTATGEPPNQPLTAMVMASVAPTVDGAATATAEFLALETQKVQATQTSLAQQAAVTPTRRPTSTPRPRPTIPLAFAVTSPDVLAVRTNNPIVADGNLGDWLPIPPIRSEHIIYRDARWDGSKDIVVTWQLAWDDNNLYVAATAVDDIHVQTQTGSDIFKGDSVSLQIDTNYAGDLSEQVNADDFQIDLSPGDFVAIPPSAHRFQGNENDVMGDAPGHAIRVQAQQMGNGYLLEAAIPWADLNLHPVGGERLGLALNATDNDTPNTAVQELFISNVEGRQLTNPSSWGSLTLQGQGQTAAGSSAPSGPPSTSFMVEDFNYPNDDALTETYWINSPGNQVNLQLASAPNTFSGANSLAVVYQLSPVPGDYLGVERNLTAPQDWSGYRQICFWLDNSSFEGFFIFQFKEQGSETWKYRAPITPHTRGEMCLELNDQVFEVSSEKLNNIMDLTAVDNYAFYLGEGGHTEGTLYLDALQLKP